MSAERLQDGFGRSARLLGRTLRVTACDGIETRPVIVIATRAQVVIVTQIAYTLAAFSWVILAIA